MKTVVTDGSGKGYRQKVDSKNRAWTDSVSRMQLEQSILDSAGFNVATGLINLTNANQSALFYIKNDDERAMELVELGVRFGASAGGSGSLSIALTANPSAGTIIDNADAVATNFNRDLGSTRQINGDVYKGGQGYTLTGGISAAATSTSDLPGVILFDAAPFIIRQGNDLGILFTPPSGNTSIDVVVFGTFIYVDLNGH